jgi:hypothetical protein
MLSGLFRGAVAELVHEALEAAMAARPAVEGMPKQRIAVVGDIALGRALLAIYRRMAADLPTVPARSIAIVAAPGARGTRKLEDVIPGSPTRLPVGDGEFAAVVGVGAMSSLATRQCLDEWMRTVCDGGAMVLVDRTPATLATRQALCAGLTEIEQRNSGRAVVTSGLVTHVLDHAR